MAIPVERLDDMLSEKTEVVAEGWSVTDLESAMWADERIHEAQVKVDEIDKLADERIEVLKKKIETIESWRDEAKKPYLETISFFASKLMLHLKQMIDEQIAAGKKKVVKTLKLPYNKLAFRAKQPDIKRDDTNLLEWVEKNHPEFVERKVTVKWSELKKTLKQTERDGKLVYVDSNGEVVPHVELTEKPDEFTLG